MHGRQKSEADRRQKRYIRPMTATKPPFPAPGHDHDRCAADAIAHAEQVCEGRAQAHPRRSGRDHGPGREKAAWSRSWGGM